MSGLVHITGEPREEGHRVVQRCSRCGIELNDYDRTNPPQGVVGPDGEAPRFAFFKEDEPITVWPGVMSMGRSDGVADCEARGEIH